jgi:hypothetical protein
MKVHNLPKVVTKNDFPRMGGEPGSLVPKVNTLPTEPSRPITLGIVFLTSIVDSIFGHVTPF